MKGFKLLGAGLLAGCALLLVALPVSAAWAKKAKPVLQLNEKGGPAVNEAPTYFAVVIAGCFSYNDGHLTGNDAKTVTAVTTSNVDECGFDKEMTGSISKVEVTTKGKLTLTGSLTVTKEVEEETGPCKYVFSKWKLNIKVPGPVEYGGTVTGKLDKKGSNKDCEKTAEKEVVVGLSPLENPAEYFEAVLT